MTVDWHELFALSVPPLEMVIRGTAMYLFLFVVFRVVVRRRIGEIGMADLLVLVLIADAAQNAMAGEYRSVSDGCILVGTIIGWNVLIDWLAYRIPGAQKLLEPPPLLLVRDGRILHRHLRMEMMTEEELRSKLRSQGIDELADVAKAYIESDGEVSVIRRRARATSRA